MIPGMGGKINPRQMNQMMRRLGINIKEIENVLVGYGEPAFDQWKYNHL